MKNFDEVIAPFANKVVKDGIVTYEVTFKVRRITLTRSAKPKPSNCRPVSTPIGMFRSVRSAAVAYKITEQELRARIKRKEEGFSYARKEENTI